MAPPLCTVGPCLLEECFTYDEGSFFTREKCIILEPLGISCPAEEEMLAFEIEDDSGDPPWVMDEWPTVFTLELPLMVCGGVGGEEMDRGETRGLLGEAPG